MTEKRFTYDKPLVAFSKGGINDNVTSETYEFTMNTVLDLLNELHEENKRLTDKLNQTALELVGEVISQGKAVEISEMSYSDFLDYRAKNGKPMELQL